jgi:hypothetical protein
MLFKKNHHRARAIDRLWLFYNGFENIMLSLSNTDLKWHFLVKFDAYFNSNFPCICV